MLRTRVSLSNKRRLFDSLRGVESSGCVALDDFAMRFSFFTSVSVTVIEGTISVGVSIGRILAS